MKSALSIVFIILLILGLVTMLILSLLLDDIKNCDYDDEGK